MTIIQDNIKRLLAERAAAWGERGPALAEIVQTRELTKDEGHEFLRLSDEFDGYSQRIKALELQLEQERSITDFGGLLRGKPAGDLDGDLDIEAWRNLSNGERAAVAPGDSVKTHPVYDRALSSRGGDEGIANYDNLGTMVRALASGSGGGSAVVPTLWAGDLIDMARRASAIGKAGATLVPMDSRDLVIGRKTGNPTSTFRAENTGPTASDPTFDSITLSSKTLQALVKGSLEWFLDAPNAEQLIVQALSQSMADKLDQVALYGGITAAPGAADLATPPAPRGILATLNATLPANVLGGAPTNGTTPSVVNGWWNEVLDTVYTVADGNEVPNAILRSSKLARTYAKGVATDGQPIRTPDALAGIEQITPALAAVPPYTVGSNTTATDLFAGDWRQLLWGQRLEITLQPLPELFAGSGQVGVLATWRGDFGLARSSAFSVFKALKGA